MSQSLKGKTVVITGSGRSIGREMAIRIAAEGASVALLEINKANLEEVRSTIASAGGDVRAYAIDLGSESEIIETISKVEQSSDWGGKLSNDQKKYAATDVLHLHKIKNKLDIMLIRENRTKIANACFEFISYRTDLDLYGWHDVDIFKH